MNGLYLILISGISLIIGNISKRFDFKNILDIHFFMTIILVAIAIPVQFDKTIVTVLWVLLSLGITFAGIKVKPLRLFWVGYVGFIIPMARALFYDMWFLDGIERWLAMLATIGGLLFMQLYLIKLDEEIKGEIMFNIYSIVGTIITTIWIAAEIFDLGVHRDTEQILLSLLWALFAIVQIIYGVTNRRKIFNWMGIILFGIVILKILMFDISMLPNILRVLILIIVGILSLVGSFIFVRNKEKIKEFI